MDLAGVYLLLALFTLCMTVRGAEHCRCVPVYQCDFPTQPSNGGHINIRVDKDACPDLLDVCCPEANMLTDRVSPIAPTHSCGMSHSDVSFRVTGDEEAPYGQFPWMAALLKPGNKFLCGGSLIHPQVVLTAAHCIADLDAGLTVRMGEWDSQSNSESLGVQNRPVLEIVAHEQFTSGSLFNDIALLFLEFPVELGGSAGTVCLPPPMKETEGRDCVASGWGKDAWGKGGKHASIIRRVELPVVSRDECEQALRETKLGSYFKLHLSFICAGGKQGQDTCKGDGGGPLVCPTQHNPQAFEQVGVVSWGVDCGQPVPATYTNVALFRSWLDLQLLKRGLSL